MSWIYNVHLFIIEKRLREYGVGFVNVTRDITMQIRGLDKVCGYADRDEAIEVFVKFAMQRYCTTRYESGYYEIIERAVRSVITDKGHYYNEIDGYFRIRERSFRSSKKSFHTSGESAKRIMVIDHGRCLTLYDALVEAANRKETNCSPSRNGD